MGNFEAFAEDYMRYREEEFTASQQAEGVCKIIFAATGTAVGVYGLIKLGIFAFTTVIPGLQALSAAIGVTLTPTMIAYGVRTVANDDSWSKLDWSTRKNIIAGVVFFERFITFDFF